LEDGRAKRKNDVAELERGIVDKRYFLAARNLSPGKQGWITGFRLHFEVPLRSAA
jgi:hypothetical protein